MRAQSDHCPADQLRFKQGPLRRISGHIEIEASIRKLDAHPVLSRDCAIP